MEDQTGNSEGKRRFRFIDHPWLSLITFLVITVLVLGFTGTFFYRVLSLPEDSAAAQFTVSMISHIITLFIIVPFALRLPKGKRSFAQYLGDIGLTRASPFGRLVLLALSSYAILALCQMAGSVVYRISQGLPLTWTFMKNVLDVSGDLPPRSMGPVVSFPSVFEEVGSRGVMVTLFLSRFTRRKAIAASSAGFAVLHLLNLLGGRDPVWVFGQLGWAFLIGLFYGYIFVTAGSLIPPMIVHYLGNLFIASFTPEIQAASTGVQVLYGVVFSLGIVPVVLMILWVRFFSRRWPFVHGIASDDKGT